MTNRVLDVASKDQHERSVRQAGLHETFGYDASGEVRRALRVARDFPRAVLAEAGRDGEGEVARERDGKPHDTEGGRPKGPGDVRGAQERHGATHEFPSREQGGASERSTIVLHGRSAAW